MTSLGDLLSRADRERLLDRVDELRELDALMRQPGTLAAPRHETVVITAKEAPGNAEV